MFFCSVAMFFETVYGCVTQIDESANSGAARNVHQCFGSLGVDPLTTLRVLTQVTCEMQDRVDSIADAAQGSSICQVGANVFNAVVWSDVRCSLMHHQSQALALRCGSERREGGRADKPRAPGYEYARTHGAAEVRRDCSRRR